MTSIDIHGPFRCGGSRRYNISKSQRSSKSSDDAYEVKQESLHAKAFKSVKDLNCKSDL